MIVFGQTVVDWVASRTSEFGSFGAATGIGVVRDGELIGGVVYNDWNGASVCMHCAGGNGWLTRTLLWYAFDYPFNQLKVKRATALIGEGNTPARTLNEQLGFRYETRIRDAHPTGDMIVMEMRREWCRWLKLKRPANEKLAA